MKKDEEEGGGVPIMVTLYMYVHEKHSCVVMPDIKLKIHKKAEQKVHIPQTPTSSLNKSKF